MLSSEIQSWIEAEFLPLQLTTPAPTITQIIDNAIRYWNTHSAFKTLQMVDISAGGAVVTLDKSIKQVINAYPSENPGSFLNQHPIFTLTGIAAIGRRTTDIIQLATAFQHFQIYISTDFRWSFVKNDDPTLGGDLFMQHVPGGVTSLLVMGTKRIIENEDIKSEYILDWLLHYVKALVKKAEGNLLRKSDIMGIKNDGQELFNEGEKEEEELRERLFAESMWVSLARRI